MKRVRFRRMHAAVLFLLALCLFTGLRRGKQALATYRAGERDGVRAQLSRVEGLRPLLSGVDVLGYVAERTPGSTKRDMRAVRDFYLTQYALAPALVVPDSTQPLLVADVSDSLALETFADSMGYEIVVTLESGVSLLRSAGP
jgi:hypothetical protein